MNRIEEVINEKEIKQTWRAKKLSKSFEISNTYACNRERPSLGMLNKTEILKKIVEILKT